MFSHLLWSKEHKHWKFIHFVRSGPKSTCFPLLFQNKLASCNQKLAQKCILFGYISKVLVYKLNFVINQGCHEQYWSQKHWRIDTTSVWWLVTDNLFYLLHICHGCQTHKTLSTVSPKLMLAPVSLSIVTNKHQTLHYVALCNSRYLLFCLVTYYCQCDRVGRVQFSLYWYLFALLCRSKMGQN